MKKLFKIIGSLLLILILAGTAVYFLFPQKLIDFTNNQYANAANLTKNVITVNDYKVHYFSSSEMNKKETIILVHGMGDDKNSFLQTAELLSKNYNIILPDLLGHGENERDPSKDYSINGQSSFLKNFTNELNLAQFHLVGNSIGGHTVAAYAIKYPKDIKTLILLNAAGLKLDDHIVYTGFGKDIETNEEFNTVLSRVFYKTPELPGPIKKHLIKGINASKNWVDNTLVTAIKNGDYFNLKNTIQYIKAPTLVLWGKHDKVVPFKSAEYFNDHIRTSKLQILNNASHSPQLEIPNEVANAINQFIIKPTYNKMERTKKSHLAKVQLYRWYQLYEREINNNRINNQMEILSEDVTITSAAGTMKGKENYPERLDAYKGWKNAHHVKNVNIIENENGSFNLEADIHYQNIKPDNAKSSYSIHYSNTLENTSDTFPIFSSINIKSTGELNKDFKDGYPENRAKSLMHYWLALMESLDGNSEPFKELLAENFELQFSTQSNITSIEQLHKWLNGTPLGLKQSNHYPENFSIKEVGKNLYEVIVEFDWYGFTKDNKKVKAKTHHTWLVTDNINDRFAKIKKVVVKQIEPFKVVE